VPGTQGPPIGARHPRSPDDGIAEARAELAEFKRIIADYEMAQMIQACGEVLRLKVVPAHVRNEIMELVADVWQL
jgi:hypothetical protein